MSAWYWIGGSILVFAAGEYFSKAWVLSGGKISLAMLVVGCYMVGSIFWLVGFKDIERLTSSGTVWNVGAMTATLGVAIVSGS